MSETKKRGRKKAYPNIWETVVEQTDGDEAKALKEYHRYRLLADEQGLNSDADVDDVEAPEPTEARPRGRPKGSGNKKRPIDTDIEGLTASERKGRREHKGVAEGQAPGPAEGAAATARKKRGRPKGSSRRGRGRPPKLPREEKAVADSSGEEPLQGDGEATEDKEDEPQQKRKKKRASVGALTVEDLYAQLLAAKDAELRAERDAKEAQRLRAEAERRRADDLKELAMSYAKGQRPTGAAATAVRQGDGSVDQMLADLPKRGGVSKEHTSSERQPKQRSQQAPQGSTPADKQQELRSKRKHDKHVDAAKTPAAAANASAAAAATPGAADASGSPA